MPLSAVSFDINGHEYLTGLNLADLVLRDSSQIDILLDAQYYFDIMCSMVAIPKSPNLAPYTIETMFGWVLAGSFSSEQGITSTNCLLVTDTSKLENLVQKFGTKMQSVLLIKVSHLLVMSNAVQQFNNSVLFNGERYVV